MTANASAGAGTGHPPWVPDDLFPFESRFADLPGWRLHCIDEGNGPTPLLLHGNPTWSFLYRDIVKGLSDRYRCIAVDHPGFGLSKAAPGYRYTPGEHALALEQLVQRLDLSDVTMMVQDWGGPIGFAVATRQPERFAGFVIGNTWAWPKSDAGTELFSRLLGGPIGRRLILNRNLFVERILPAGVRRGTLPEAVMNAYRGPFPTPASRWPTAIFPREILASRPFLATIEQGLAQLSDHRPALIVWPTKDVAFGDRERRRWEQPFPTTTPSHWKAPVITSRRTPPRRSSPRSGTGGRRTRQAVQANRADVNLSRSARRRLDRQREGVLGELAQVQRRDRESPVSPDQSRMRARGPELAPSKDTTTPRRRRDPAADRQELVRVRLVGERAVAVLLRAVEMDIEARRDERHDLGAHVRDRSPLGGDDGEGVVELGAQRRRFDRLELTRCLA
jgi:haloalkane dehalogenase